MLYSAPFKFDALEQSPLELAAQEVPLLVYSRSVCDFISVQFNRTQWQENLA